VLGEDLVAEGLRGGELNPTTEKATQIASVRAATGVERDRRMKGWRGGGQ
jgi:hypothetical protein